MYHMYSEVDIFLFGIPCPFRIPAFDIGSTLDLVEACHTHFMASGYTWEPTFAILSLAQDRILKILGYL